MNEYFVYYGREKYAFEISQGWVVLQNPVAGKSDAHATIPDMVKKALDSPVSSPRLSEMVHKDTRVAIIVDDMSRNTPASEILPAVLEELEKGGCDRSNIDIVVARGTHREMPEDALIKKVGKTVLGNYRVSQHNSHAEDLIPVGNLITGAQVKINPLVARADVKIGIGSIAPHPMNGFGGGPKILMPGVANYGAIKEHHLHFTPEPGCFVGNIEANPFYLEVCRVAEMAGLNFIVNCVLNSMEEVVDVVAGHFREAHLEGIEKSRNNYGLALEKPADITIISAYPYSEGPQIIKPVIPSSLLATKPGGSVIIVAECPYGMPEPMLKAFDEVYAGKPANPARFAVDVFKSFNLFVEGAIDFNCAIFFSLICAARTNIIVISRDLDRHTINRLGFNYAESLEDAILTEAMQKPQATVNIFPVGGTLLLMTKEQPSLL